MQLIKSSKRGSNGSTMGWRVLLAQVRLCNAEVPHQLFAHGQLVHTIKVNGHSYPFARK